VTKNRKLAREQLDHTLDALRPLRDASIPPKGWVRAIRDALGMSGRQLADRLGVARQRIVEIERDEISGSVTLRTMRKVAERFDSVFVYGFVPRTSLEQLVRAQATKIANDRMARVTQTMRLEDQGLVQSEDDDSLKRIIEVLMDSPPPNFWDQ
jgi:predicted DNA-binding mobile mystery protein A